MLTVLYPFDGYCVGQKITDKEKIKEIMESEKQRFVIFVPLEGDGNGV